MSPPLSLRERRPLPALNRLGLAPFGQSRCHNAEDECRVWHPLCPSYREGERVWAAAWTDSQSGVAVPPAGDGLCRRTPYRERQAAETRRYAHRFDSDTDPEKDVRIRVS